MTTTTIPVTITPDASGHIANLGMQREFEQMLDRVLQTIPDLHDIEVTLEPDHEEGLHPGIVIWYAKDEPAQDGYDPSQAQLGEWKVMTFPPEVCWHFCMIARYEAPNAR
jgi:hypothetical protein